MIDGRRFYWAGCTTLALSLVGCTSSPGSIPPDTPSYKNVAVQIEKASLSADRRTVTVQAGQVPLTSCDASDAGITTSVQDDVLVVTVLRRVALEELSSPCARPCLPAVTSEIELTEPLPVTVVTARSAPSAIATCTTDGANEALRIRT